MRTLFGAVVLATLLVSYLRADQPAKPKAVAAPNKPRVEFLPDPLGADIGISLEGMPVPLGEKLRIAYVCHGENGLAKASLLYRVLKEGDKAASPWVSLALAEVKQDDKSGPFNPRLGVFAKTKFDEQVPFHAIPVANLQAKGVRPQGGGRILLSTVGLIDDKGKPVPLQAGDRIEYYVEVTEIERKPAPIATMRSAPRVTPVVTLAEYLMWVRRALDEDQRIKDLQRKQKDLFKEKQP